MSLDRQEIESILDNLGHAESPDFRLGVIATLYAAAKDADVQEELVESLVYQQTINYQEAAKVVGEATQGISDAVGISREQLERAGRKVYEIISASQEGAANETQ